MYFLIYVEHILPTAAQQPGIFSFQTDAKIDVKSLDSDPRSWFKSYDVKFSPC